MKLLSHWEQLSAHSAILVARRREKSGAPPDRPQTIQIELGIGANRPSIQLGVSGPVGQREIQDNMIGCHIGFIQNVFTSVDVTSS